MSQLRGHWEDTSGKVQARKNTLEELASDNRHFEVKQQEIEAWLGRMEAWQARLRPVGATQDILEQQSRELKVYSYLDSVRGRSQTRLTDFLAFWTPLPP